MREVVEQFTFVYVRNLTVALLLNLNQTDGFPLVTECNIRRWRTISPVILTDCRSGLLRNDTERARRDPSQQISVESRVRAAVGALVSTKRRIGNALRQENREPLVAMGEYLGGSRGGDATTRQ